MQSSVCAEKSTDRGLLWFGFFTAAYGIRLIFFASSFRFATEPIPARVWFYLAAAITYSLPLLGALFLQELFPEWRSIFRWLIPGFAVFAGVGIAVDQILRRPDSVRLLNNVIVILTFSVLLPALYRYRTSAHLRLLRIGGLAFFISIVITNVWNLYTRDLPMHLGMLEPLGFTCFLAGLGSLVISRIFEREEQLIAVNKELDVARRIQTSILPREAPSSPFVTLATRYLAMTAVAGDFYDFLVVDEHRIGIVIADVSGHGVPAALIASMVKVAVWAQLPCAQDPAQVLAGMNRILCGKMQGQFVSSGYLFLDLKKQLMRYAGAGHPPLLRYERDGAEWISENGLPLGLFASASYNATERPLIPGSRFLLYTDGLIEASDSTDQFFGEERVRAVLEQAETLSAEETVALLVERVMAWSDARQQDDLTMIVIDIRD